MTDHTELESTNWSPRKKSAWQALKSHYRNPNDFNIKRLFSKEKERTKQLSVSTGALYIDFSKNLIDAKSIRLLIKLAEESQLNAKIDDMFSGSFVNNTEHRQALHTSLRVPPKTASFADDKSNIQQKIQQTLSKMEAFCTEIHSGTWTGYTGKTITNIVNIGVGGSDLGPQMACHALRFYKLPSITSHFISNIDDTDLGNTLKQLDPETTLFIVASKSFSTLETMQNANNARTWFLRSAKESDIEKHFVAVSSNTEKTQTFGIALANIFPMWDWVGGRYSLWSAIGLSIALSIGMKSFREVLAGGHEMDLHFKNTPLNENAPVLLGLMGIVYGNMLNTQSQAIIPYDENLALFPSYLQQLEMESIGKRTAVDGTTINYQTCQILWGGTGTNSQHSFHQILHQGTQLCSVDFILPLDSQYDIGDQHRYLVANCLAQSNALMNGKTEEEAISELINSGSSDEEAKKLAPHKVIPGNKPSTLICYEKMNPRILGQLIALYEHKVYVQSVIWGINPFDQWGVELGKQLCDSVEPYLRADNNIPLTDIDPSTAEIISRYRKLQSK